METRWVRSTLAPNQTENTRRADGGKRIPSTELACTKAGSPHAWQYIMGARMPQGMLGAAAALRVDRGTVEKKQECARRGKSHAERRETPFMFC